MSSRADIDELRIVIEASDGGAVAKLEAIIEKLDNLKIVSENSPSGKKVKELGDNATEASKKLDSATESAEKYNSAMARADGLDLANATQKIEALNWKLQSASERLGNLFNEDEVDMGKLADAVLNVKRIQEQIEKATTQMNELTESTSELEEISGRAVDAWSRADAEAFLNNTSNIDLLNQKLDIAIEKVARLHNEGEDGITFTKAVEEVKRLEKQIEKATQAQEKLDAESSKAMQSLQVEAEETTDAFGRVIDKAESTWKGSGVFALPKMPQIDYGKWNSQGKAIESTSSALKKLIPLLGTAGKGMATLGTSVAGTASKMMFFPFNKIGSGLKTITKGVDKLASKFKTVVMYRMLRGLWKVINSGFQEGIANVYQWSKALGDSIRVGQGFNSFSQNMDNLATSALYLKNAFGAMVTPLINAVAPALDYVVDKVVDFLNVINMLFARLTNSPTWNKAIRYPIEFAEGLDEATGRAKDLKDAITILGIDEINPLDAVKEPSSGSGGLDDVLDYSSMFEEIETESTSLFNGLFEPLKNAWETSGQPVIDSFNGMMTSLQSTINAVGGSFWSVWTNGTGQKSVELLLGTLTGILNTVTAISDAFKRSWITGDLGTSIVQNFWNALNNVLTMWNNIANQTAEWAEGLDFTPFLTALEGLSSSAENITSVLADIGQTIWVDIVEPITKWALESGLPQIVNTLSNVLNTIASIGSKWNEAWKSDSAGSNIISNVVEAIDGVLATIEDISEITAKWAENLNLDPFLSAIEDLTGGFKDLLEPLEGGIKWAWENILLPLGKWGIEKGLPDELASLGSALSGIATILKEISESKAGEILGGILKGAVDLVTSISGKTFLEPLKDFAKALNDIADILSGEKTLKNVFAEWLEEIVLRVGVQLEYLKKAWDGIMSGDWSTVGDALLNAYDPTHSELYIKIKAEAEIEKATEAKGFKKPSLGASASFGDFGYDSKWKTPKVASLSNLNTFDIDQRLKTTPPKLSTTANATSLQDSIKNKTIGGFTSKLGGWVDAFKTKTIGGWTSKLGGWVDAFKTKTVGGWTSVLSAWARGYTGTSKSQQISGWTSMLNYWARSYTGSSQSQKVDGWTSILNYWQRGYMGSYWNQEVGGFTSILQYIKDNIPDGDRWVTGITAYIKTLAKASGFSGFNGDLIITKDASGSLKYQAKRKGGIYNNGIWKNIPQYAGGTLDAGSLFVAGEAGAEIVANVNGRTEVLNRSQIASAMEASVISGNAQQNRLLQEQNQLLRELINKQGNARAYVTSGDIIDGLQQRNRRDGRTVVAIGV